MLLPHEMSYPTARTLQYGVTPAQESASLVHMFRYSRSSTVSSQAPGLFVSAAESLKKRQIKAADGMLTPFA